MNRRLVSRVDGPHGGFRPLPKQRVGAKRACWLKTWGPCQESIWHTWWSGTRLWGSRRRAWRLGIHLLGSGLIAVVTEQFHPRDMWRRRTYPKRGAGPQANCLVTCVWTHGPGCSVSYYAVTCNHTGICLRHNRREYPSFKVLTIYKILQQALHRAVKMNISFFLAHML